MVTLHRSLGWRKQRVNVLQQCWKKSRNLGCSSPYLLRFEVGNKSLMAHKQLLWCLTFTAMLTKHTRVSSTDLYLNITEQIIILKNH